MAAEILSCEFGEFGISFRSKNFMNTTHKIKPSGCAALAMHLACHLARSEDQIEEHRPAYSSRAFQSSQSNRISCS